MRERSFAPYGLTSVDYVVREGEIQKQLQQAAVETEAEVMVMGRPVRRSGRNVFKAGEMEMIAARVEKEGGLRLILVPPSPED